MAPLSSSSCDLTKVALASAMSASPAKFQQAQVTSSLGIKITHQQPSHKNGTNSAKSILNSWGKTNCWLEVRDFKIDLLLTAEGSTRDDLFYGAAHRFKTVDSMCYIFLRFIWKLSISSSNACHDSLTCCMHLLVSESATKKCTAEFLLNAVKPNQSIKLTWLARRPWPRQQLCSKSCQQVSSRTKLKMEMHPPSPDDWSPNLVIEASRNASPKTYPNIVICTTKSSAIRFWIIPPTTTTSRFQRDPWVRRFMELPKRNTARIFYGPRWRRSRGVTIWWYNVRSPVLVYYRE